MPEAQEDVAERIRQERESFVVLQHVYTLSDADAGVPVPLARVSGELGFEQRRFAPLLEQLIAVGYVAPIAGGSYAVITSEGVAYIEQLAWRRRSVRLDVPDEEPATPAP
jgi:hypothetical protein